MAAPLRGAINAITTLPGAAAAPIPHLDRRLIGPPLLLKHAAGSSGPAHVALFKADFYFYIRMTSARHVIADFVLENGCFGVGGGSEPRNAAGGHFSCAMG